MTCGTCWLTGAVEPQVGREGPGGLFSPLSATLGTLGEKGQCEGGGLFGVLILPQTLFSPRPPQFTSRLEETWPATFGSLPEHLPCAHLA